MPVVQSKELGNIINRKHQLNAGHSFLLLAVVLMFNLFFALLLKSLQPLPRTYLIAIFTSQLLAIGLPVWLFTRLKRLNLAKTFPLKKLSGRTILLIILIATSNFVILAQINLFLEPLSQIYRESITQIQHQRIFASQYNISLFIIGTALLPAICEEFLFRGVIFAGLRNSAGKIWALVVSSLLFGLIHFILPWVILMTLLGLLLGVLFILTGSLIAPILVHLLNNVLAIVCLLNIKHIPWLNETSISIPLFILLPSIGLFILSFCLLIRNKNT